MVSMPNSRQDSGQPRTLKSSNADVVSGTDLSQWRLTLAETLNVHEVLHRFFNGIAQRIRISHMAFTPLTDLKPVSFGSKAIHSAAYNLKTRGYALGTLTFSRDQRFSNEELEAIENTVTCLFHPLRNALLYQEALSNSLSDQMTKLGNRAAFELAIKRQLGLSKRHGQPVSLVMLDVDHFKSINDRFGHPAGDACLTSIATTLRDALRDTDEVFRFGGEEFAVLLAETTREQALVVAERLRTAVAAKAVTAFQCEPISVTVSAGTATLKADDDRDSFIMRADKALYEAKRSGRNCVIAEQGQPIAAASA